MHGIGDTIYARPFIRHLVEDGNDVYVNSPLPFLLQDLGVKFLETDTIYRTQGKSLREEQVIYSKPPDKFDRVIDFFYSGMQLRRHGIVTHLEVSFGYEPGSTLPIFDLPRLPHHGLDLPKKTAVIRPVTYRSEWHCTSRSPQASYVAWCAKILKDMGYYVVSIADCDGENEWIDASGDPDVNLKLHAGELKLPQVLSLIRDADLVVGGSGFIVPAAVAAGTNLFIIFGGRGMYDNPHKILDLRMDLKKIGWALPTN